MQNYVTLKVCIIVDYEDLFAQCSVGSHISRLNRPRTEQRGAASERARARRANEVESGPKKELFWETEKTQVAPVTRDSFLLIGNKGSMKGPSTMAGN